MFSIIFCFFSLFMSLSSFCFVSLFLYRKRRLIGDELERAARESQEANREEDPSAMAQSPARIVARVCGEGEKGGTQLTHSLLLEILPNESAEWVRLLGGEVSSGSVDSGDRREKKKRRRSKKVRSDSDSNSNLGSEDGSGCVGLESDGGDRLKDELVCLYPFTSSSSATQRRIKQQYDQLVKSQESKGLTLAQVGQFANCLVEARNELQQKSEAIQRKFPLKRALLFKADRSSFDRIRQQIYKLELEQRRLEEDAFVYNWLQQQLNLSPVYQKMLETDAYTESTLKPDEPTESTDTEFDDISFEELLAQEKKDSFWQKNGRRSCSS